MNRFLATTAIVGALLTAPAWAQTMNSAPAPAATPAPMGATSNAPAQASDQDQTAAPQAARQAPAEASGSSMRPAHHRSHRKAGDDSADQLNQAELQKLSGR
jgi:hypothetical protein